MISWKGSPAAETRKLIPLNKQLWTPSFAIYTAGLGMLGLGACFYLSDVLGIMRDVTSPESLIPSVSRSLIGKLMEEEAIAGGMIPKGAVDMGNKRAVIDVLKAVEGEAKRRGTARVKKAAGDAAGTEAKK